MPGTFLDTKMYWTRVRPNLVARPRLLEKLDQGLDAGHCLTLVSAPAGYGKTTLLHEWLSGKDQRSPSGDEGRSQKDEGGSRSESLHPSSSLDVASRELHGRSATLRPALHHTQCGASVLHPFKVAWLTLDEADNDPTRFWAYAILSLRSMHEELGETALAQLRAPQPPPLPLILPSLLNEIQSLRDRAILVLDDYHIIRSPSVHQSIAFVLEHLPTTLHLMLSTRMDPPLPLARLRANDLITEVRASDLLFTLGEAETLFNDCNHLNLSSDDVLAIAGKTEGWVSGLQLAALSLKGRDAAGRAQLIANFSGRQPFILDYLTDEVLSRQSEAVQAFLLCTSILDRLNGSLCDAVTERSDSQALLRNLDKANLFVVPLDPEGNWYRYHHLFAELLQARLRESRPGELIRLHTRASSWFEENGLAAEAVQHALAAGDSERAAQLVKQFAREMFTGSEIRTLLSWLRGLPQDRVSTDPHLSMICAWALLATSQMDAVNPHLMDVERALGLTAEDARKLGSLPPSVRGTLAEVFCIRSNLAFHARDAFSALELSEESLAYLGQDVQQGLFQPRQAMESILAFNCGLAHELLGDVKAAEEEFNNVLAIEPRDWHMVHLAAGHLAQLFLIQGRLKEAEEFCREVMNWGAESRNRPTPYSGLAHAELGTILCEWNQLEEAESEFKQGLELARPWSNLEGLLLAYAGLARIQAAKGKYEDALRAWEELRHMAQTVKAPWAIALIEAHRASLWVRQGHPEAARRWIERAATAKQGSVPYMQEAEGIVLARVLIALGDIDRAIILLQSMGQAAEAGGRTGRWIEILALQALAAEAQGKTAQALSDLRASLLLAEPKGYVRVYLDEGEPMIDLLQQTAARDPTDAYVARLLALFRASRAPELATEGSASSTRSHSTGQLTSRELEVLRLLAEGLSNREIAQKLFLSPNTMRVYTYNIYGKLDVHNRMQAVLKARQLGLLPASR